MGCGSVRGDNGIIDDGLSEKWYNTYQLEAAGKVKARSLFFQMFSHNCFLHCYKCLEL